MWGGAYLSRTSKSVFSWCIVTELIENLIERGEYKVRLGLQNAPVYAEQVTLFDMGDRAPIFESPDTGHEFTLFSPRPIPQAVIDKLLFTGGNGPCINLTFALFLFSGYRAGRAGL